MFQHPHFVHAPGQTPAQPQPTVNVAPHVGVRQPHPPHQMNPQSSLYGQRAQVSLQMARQRALADALRAGGGMGGAPPAAPSLGINRPQGLPTMR